MDSRHVVIHPVSTDHCHPGGQWVTQLELAQSHTYWGRSGASEIRKDAVLQVHHSLTDVRWHRLTLLRCPASGSILGYHRTERSMPRLPAFPLALGMPIVSILIQFPTRAAFAKRIWGSILVGYGECRQVKVDLALT